MHLLPPSLDQLIIFLFINHFPSRPRPTTLVIDHVQEDAYSNFIYLYIYMHLYLSIYIDTHTYIYSVSFNTKCMTKRTAQSPSCRLSVWRSMTTHKRGLCSQVSQVAAPQGNEPVFSLFWMTHRPIFLSHSWGIFPPGLLTSPRRVSLSYATPTGSVRGRTVFTKRYGTLLGPSTYDCRVIWKQGFWRWNQVEVIKVGPDPM